MQYLLQTADYISVFYDSGNIELQDIKYAAKGQKVRKRLSPVSKLMLTEQYSRNEEPVIF